MSRENDKDIYVSLVIPCFNEEAKIENDISKAWEYFSAQDFSTEIIVSDDGSKDGTVKKAGAYAEKLMAEKKSDKVSVRVLDNAENRGKGHAVKKGVLQAVGSVIFFADAGLCVPFNNAERGLKCIKEGADLAIGSRTLECSNIRQKQPLYRQLGSRAFGYIVRLLMGLPDFVDTQCGFKFYKHDVAYDLFNAQKIDGFMFDIELLKNAKKKGYTVKEFPVEWSNDSDTRLNPVLGSFRIMKELIRIRFS
jgi:glycosyltransferase involved in cell wall biosynthesis